MAGYTSGLGTALILLTACSTGTAAVEASCDPSPYERDVPLVIAHAGGNSIAPANTMYALHTAMDAGADVLDLDVRMTADGVVVARHDRELSTTTDGSGPVDQAMWAEVSQLDATMNWTGDPVSEAVGVPSVEDALMAFPDTKFSLEIKQTVPALGQQLCDVLERTGAANRVFVSSNDDDASYGFQEVCEGVQLTTTYRDLDERNAAQAAGEPWCAASPIGQPSFSAGFDAERVAEAHAQGSAIFVWTVNDPDDLRYVAEIGVDAVYTDRPDLARKIFDEVAAKQ